MELEWDAFLDWFKEATETAWANLPETAVQDTFKKRRALGPVWQKGTRWLGGMSADSLTAVQQKYALTFPPAYHQFLLKLGAPDRPLLRPGWQDGTLTAVESPSFYNWLTDDEAITAALRWPLEGLLFDVEQNHFWLDSWGKKPEDAGKTSAHLADLLTAAPPLIPLYGHRYLLDYPVRGQYPVLSVYQSDIILYAPDLQSYLLREMAQLLNIYVEESVAQQVDTFYPDPIAAIPFWGDIMWQE